MLYNVFELVNKLNTYCAARISKLTAKDSGQVVKSEDAGFAALHGVNY